MEVSVPAMRQRTGYIRRHEAIELGADLLGAESEPRVRLHHSPASATHDCAARVGIDITMRLNHRSDSVTNLKWRNGEGKQAGNRDCGKGPSSPAPNEKKHTHRNAKQEDTACQAQDETDPEER